MRRLHPAIFLLCIATLETHGQEVEARRAEPWISPCEALCDNLKKAIQERPDLMVMRIEDALVINEDCAAEIVTAAMDAVRGKPGMVQEIVDTALKIAPSRTAIVMEAVHSYSPASERAVAMEEVRRAVIPANAPLYEVRRAEVSTLAEPTPIEEVRRAEVPALKAIDPDAESIGDGKQTAPPEEIRRAGVTAMVLPALSAQR